MANNKFKQTFGMVTFTYNQDEFEYDVHAIKLTDEGRMIAQGWMMQEIIHYVHEMYEGDEFKYGNHCDGDDGWFTETFFMFDAMDRGGNEALKRRYYRRTAWDNITDVVIESHWDHATNQPKWADPEYKDKDYSDDINRLMRNIYEGWAYERCIQECLDADHQMFNNAR